MQLVKPEQTIETLSIHFAQHELVLDPRGVLYWPQEKLLIASDLHLEKASFLKQFAHPLPTYDSVDTLNRLQQLVDEYAPHTVVSLGDSLHDRNAAERFDAQTLQAIHTLTNSVEQFVWIVGNHDPKIPTQLGGEVHKTLDLSGICLTHEPCASTLPQLFGHFHPKFSRSLSGQKVKGKCFVVSDHALMMPAFGTFTGGLAHDHEAIAEAMRSDYQCYLMYGQKIWAMTGS